MLELVSPSLFESLPRLLIQVISTLVLLKIYSQKTSNQDNINAFFLFGCSVFIVTFLLHRIEMSMGFAFGLFAVFSMLRYRTETLAVRDMTYLFIIISISLITAVSQVTLLTLIIINGFICILAYFSELRVKSSPTDEKIILYEKINNIKPQHYQALLDDLKERTGLPVYKAKILDIDFLKDVASIKVFYKKPPGDGQ